VFWHGLLKVWNGLHSGISALKKTKSLQHLYLRRNHGLSERVFLALAESLPEIKVLRRVDFHWCTGLASRPCLYCWQDCARTRACFVSTLRIVHFIWSHQQLKKRLNLLAAGCRKWKKMERLGYRNRVLPVVIALKERLPPRSVWPLALARVATLPDAIFEEIRSKPNLASSEDIKAT
jgi:hypothetical protein